MRDRQGERRSFCVKGERSTLVRSALNDIPINYISVLTILVKMAKKLEAIQSILLWGDEEDRRKYHLVKWEELKND